MRCQRRLEAGRVVADALESGDRIFGVEWARRSARASDVEKKETWKSGSMSHNAPGRCVPPQHAQTATCNASRSSWARDWIVKGFSMKCFTPRLRARSISSECMKPVERITGMSGLL